MGKMLFRKKLITAKLEGTYGTDATPTAAANAIRAHQLSITPLASEQLQREPVQPYLGAGQAYLVGKHVQLSFRVEAAGSGDPVTPPAYGPLLQACGMAETIDATVGSENVSYLPVSESFDSASIYFYLDKKLHKVLGARGTVTVSVQATGEGKIPYFEFQMVGLFTAPAAEVLPSPDFSAFQTPLPANPSNTTFSLHGHPAILAQATLALGQQVQFVPRVNEESVMITDRRGTATFQVEEPELGTKDYWAAAIGHTLGAAQIVHGTQAGNIVQLDAPAVQILEIGQGESEGIAMLDLNTQLRPTDAGDDELKITVK